MINAHITPIIIYVLTFVLTFAMLYQLTNGKSHSINESTPQCTICLDLVNIIDLQIKTANATVSILEELIYCICNMIINTPEKKRMSTY